MGEAALNIVNTEQKQATQQLTLVESVAQAGTPTKEILILSAILIFLQISDGILTALGIHIYGIGAEGNILLRVLMEKWGYLPVLVAAKSFAIIAIGLLYMLAMRVSWLSKAMKCVIVIYLAAAIIPWSLVLLKGFS